jgi:hypothetical protein
MDPLGVWLANLAVEAVALPLVAASRRRYTHVRNAIVTRVRAQRKAISPPGALVPRRRQVIASVAVSRNRGLDRLGDSFIQRAG